MEAMNLYPEQLRQIAAMCEGMNKADEMAPMPDNGMGLLLRDVAVETEDGLLVGHLRDEVGGAWSFTPALPDHPLDPVLKDLDDATAYPYITTPPAPA